MSFEVFQGQVSAANAVAVDAANAEVFVAGTGAGTTVKLQAPATDASPKPVKEKADSVTVFVNEKGRDVTIQWNASPSGSTGAVPKNQPTTVATPGPDQWLITKDDGNLREDKIDAAYQAVTPSGWQKQATVKFTLSNCGRDNFIVTHEQMVAGKPQRAHLVVSVRKRIRCHLIEMRRSAQSNNDDTFTDYRGPLGYAQGILAHYGIDLVFANDKIEPERATAFFAKRNENQLRAMIPEASASGRSATDLWINVVNEIDGTEDGLGGQSAVHVEIKKNQDAKTAYESWVSDWENSKGRTTKDRWVSRHRSEDQKLARQLASGGTTPDEIAEANLKSLLIHEIGHALGLVPTDEKAGGKVQSSWRDAQHAGHCSKATCVMFWKSGSAQLGLEAQLRLRTPFDHVSAYGNDKNDEEACTLFLRACDISDLRNLPR